MDKKNIIIIVIVIVVLAAGAFLWRGGFLGQKAGAIPGIGGQNNGQAVTGVGNKMTDEIQIEIMTEIAKSAINNPGQSEEETLKETTAILNKYGITPVEYGAYVEALYKDEARSAAMTEKQQQIMMEILKAGGK